MSYPKRLIEVDLPIKQISAHARREKSIRHGHISTLHIWWARRPLAACRAVICAALWPDPADELCPQLFRDRAGHILAGFAEQVRTDSTLAGLVAGHWSRWHRTNEATFGMQNAECRTQNEEDSAFRTLRGHSALAKGDPAVLYTDMRYALLDFIADFANWDASTVPAFLETARALTQAAHEALGGELGTRPLVVDPFAGGGAIPLEALRVGAETFASDLNPVAVLLNKVVLEYIPKYGNAECRVRNAAGEEVVLRGLAEMVRYWGGWIKEQAELELAEFYPRDPDGATPIAYLWARTIISEAPDDGAGIPVEVPLMRSLWLAKKSGRSVALRWVRDDQGQVQTETVAMTYADGVTRQVRRPLLEIFEPKSAREVENGTAVRGSATCPVTGYTTPVASVRRQLKERRGGADDARLFCVVTTRQSDGSRSYRLPTEQDLFAVQQVKAELEQRKQKHVGSLSLIPDEKLDIRGIRHTWAMIYGMTTWGDVFLSRQGLALATFAKYVQQVVHDGEIILTAALQTCLALAVNRGADYWSSLALWSGDFVAHTFGRQALPFVSDFAEVAPFCNGSGNWDGAIDWIARCIEREGVLATSNGEVLQASASNHPLPNDIGNAFITDPPYFEQAWWNYYHQR